MLFIYVKHRQDDKVADDKDNKDERERERDAGGVEVEGRRQKETFALCVTAVLRQ